MSWRRAEVGGWDETLASARDANVFQSLGWAHHKEGAAWTSDRYVARDASGRVIAMIQVLSRPIGPLRVSWAPGGPVLGFAAATPEVSVGLVERLSPLLGARAPAYARIASHHPTTPALSTAFERAFRHPVRPLTTGYSMIVDLTRPMDAILTGMAPKHRYNTKRALARPIEWHVGGDDAAPDLVDLYNEMAGAKARHLRRLDVERVRSLIRSLGRTAGILVGRAGAVPVTACLFGIAGDRAYALLPATAPRGRAMSAGFALHHELFRRLRELGIREVDLAGADPSQRDNEVDRFKAGFGATLVEYLGEWECARPAWLRRAVSLLAGLRGGDL